MCKARKLVLKNSLQNFKERSMSIRKLALLLVFVMAAAMLSSGVLAQDDEIVVEPGDDIVLGLAVSLSGDTAPFGIDIQRGVELAQEDRPTVTVDGVEFNVVIDAQDSACSAETGQAVANRFAADPSIAGVIGHMCSSACNAAAPIYDAAGYTSISPSCTAPTLTQQGYTSFNRAVTPDGIQGTLAAEFIYNELGVTKIATIHDGSAYGEGLVTVLIPAFEALGGEVVASDAVNVGDTDFRALLEEIASAEPELIYFAGFPNEAALLAQQRADAGLGDVIFMGADGIQGPEFIEQAGEAAEGAYASVAIPFSSDDLDMLLERYVATYGEEPPGPYYPNGYDAYNIFLDAIEAVGEINEDGALVISRSALQEYVRSFEGFEGMTGLLSADGTGETSSSAIGFYQVQDGEFVEVLVMGGMEDDMMMEEPTMAISDIALSDPNFSTLVEAVLAADPSVLDALLTAESLTIFAPTNDAFEASGIVVTDLDAETLTNVLLYHAVEGEFDAAALVEMGSGTLTTLLGEDITFEVVDGAVVLNGTVTVVMPDVYATNGVIHVIDGVLLPGE